MKQCTGIIYPASLVAVNHWYSFNFLNTEKWGGMMAMLASQRSNKTAQQLKAKKILLTGVSIRMQRGTAGWWQSSWEQGLLGILPWR
jgi:hypothetical protein